MNINIAIMKAGWIFAAIQLSMTALGDASYTIDWHKIAGGGGTSSNASYQVTGTIGQPDASGALTGGGFSLAGGYLEAIAPIQSTYAAGPGGTIAGMGSQWLNYGSSGNPVTAVPSPGYHFVSWSDGVTTATRTDLNETSNLSVTALFAINTNVPLLAPVGFLSDGSFALDVSGVVGLTTIFEATTDLLHWVPLSTNTPTSSPFRLVDPGATGFGNRYYRVVQP